MAAAAKAAAAAGAAAAPAAPAPEPAPADPPDGGWGWAVVAASFISVGFAYAFPKSLTIYYKEIQEYFSVSYSQIAWVSSLMLASMAPEQHSCQPLRQQTGGHGWRPHRFRRHGARLLWNLHAPPVPVCGSPRRGSFLVLGALVLNCCVAGALMRPVDAGRARAEAPSEQRQRPGRSRRAERGAAAERVAAAAQAAGRRPGAFLDASLFRHRGFLIYLLGNVLMFFGFFAPVVFLAPYAKHLGVDEYSAAFLLSIFALVDMFVRPATGLLANSKRIRPRIQYLFSFAVCYNAACHLLCPLARGYAGLALYAVFFGTAFGMVCALLFEVLMDLVGAQRFSSAVGLVTLIECGPVLLGPPLSGALVDVWGDYKYMYYACGAFMLLPGVFFFIMHYYNYKRADEEQRHGLSAEMRTPQEALQLKPEGI
ncbi:monocarboxylate transporter 2-like isoform X2 [Syngnathus typhle]|uniref:monocarboxylate transporter 2-like isoform X2 n=1 Tax=Syngnathus typhle TaxID=161592 RepID=UPI002A6AF2F0|nr:monocarboxylate transporter 2-like isoform X2 [Syngnathus typhle]